MSCETQSSKICAIPLDVLTTILGFLRPSDVIQTRLTCKHIRDASFHRSVWVASLRGMMAEHGIPSMTFPVAKLKQPTLEHLALSPLKFRRKLKIASERPSKTIPAILAQYAFCDPTEEELGALEIRKLLRYEWIDLCPGGKVLVSARLVYKVNGGDSLFIFIQLWDLGIPTIAQRPRVIAGLVLPNPEGKDYRFNRFLLSPSHTGQELNLLVHRTRLDPTTGIEEMGLNNILIQPFRPRPKIISQGAVRYAFNECSFLVRYGDIYIGTNRQNVELWDAVRGEAIFWRIPNASTANGLQLFGDRAFLLMGKQMVQWEIPYPLTLDGSPRPHARICTLGDLMYGMPASDEALRLLPFNPWTRASTFPDFMVLSQKNDLAVYVMETLPICSRYTPRLTPDIFPRRIQKFPGMFDVAASRYSPAHACEEHLVFTSCGSEAHAEVRIHLAPTDSTTKPVGCVKTKWMELHQATAVRHVLCPATGRLCILTAKNEIVVLDFL